MISVIILTYNRKTDLLKAVESVRRSSGPAREIVIVDNGSTDGTASALAAQPDLTVLRFEKGTVLSRCRNAGIDAARGEIIAFTDDDCVVGDDWIAVIAEDLTAHDAAGGLAKPLGAVSFPRWWDEELNWMVGLTSPGHCGPLAGQVYLPASLNLAYRAEVLRRLRFREEVEGIGGKNMTREDADLWLRTRAAGFRTLIDPRLVVYHKVPQKRFTLSFCIGRAFSDGYAAYHRESGVGVWKDKAFFLAREPFRIIQRKLSGCGGSRVYDAFWMVRESGFVFAHLRAVCGGAGRPRGRQ